MTAPAPSLCVCIAGQVRLGTTGLLRLRELLRGLDATVVFSVWDRPGGKVDGSLNADQLPRVFDPALCAAIPHAWLGHENFWARLPSLLARRRAELDELSMPGGVERALREVFPDAIVDVEASDLLCLDFPMPKEDRNSLRMLYKVWRANEIKRSIERRRGRPFDLVLRMRPDLSLHAVDLPLLQASAAAGEVMVNAFVPGKAFVGDFFAAGASAGIDAYCGVFGRAIADPAGWRFIHPEIHHHLEAAGLRYVRYPHVGPLDADLTVGAQVLAQCLTQARDTLGVWSPGHAATLAAAQAVAALDAGDPGAALQVVLKALAADVATVADGALPAAADEMDGLLSVAAQALHRLGQPLDAAACQFAAFSLRRQGVLHVQQPHVDLLVAALAAAPGPQWPGPHGVENVPERPGMAPLWRWLQRRWPGAALGQMLAQHWQAMRRHPVLARLTLGQMVTAERWNELLRDGELFDFPGAEQDAAVQALRARLLHAAGAVVPLADVVQRWRAAAPADPSPLLLWADVLDRAGDPAEAATLRAGALALGLRSWVEWQRAGAPGAVPSPLLAAHAALALAAGAGWPSALADEVHAPAFRAWLSTPA